MAKSAKDFSEAATDSSLPVSRFPSNAGTFLPCPLCCEAASYCRITYRIDRHVIRHISKKCSFTKVPRFYAPSLTEKPRIVGPCPFSLSLLDDFLPPPLISGLNI